MKQFITFITVLFALAVFPLGANDSDGTIEGKVTEELRKSALSGVFVQIVNTDYSALTNESGEFKILNVPAGSYNVKFSLTGYEPMVQTDVLVRPQRITFVNVEMQERLIPIEETVEVTASYFHKNEKIPNSAFDVSAEEVRRAPGTGSGVSRMLKALPGVSSMMDITNEFIVRGGSPLENTFYIDNIQVPLINHIPFNGTSGGFWSAIDPDVVQHIDFFTGGFSPGYGDSLSSITDITLREGNRSEFDGQINLNLINFGGVLEGPIKRDKGSWLFSLRKSFLDSANDAGILHLEDDGLPETLDAQIKLTYDFSPNNKFSLLYFKGSGNYFEDPTDEEDIDITHPVSYGQNILGINWTSIWARNFFSNTILSYSNLSRFFGEVLPGGGDVWNLNEKTRCLNIKNMSVLNLSSRHKLEFGFQLKYETDKIDHDVFRDKNGNLIPLDRKQNDFSTTKFSLFLSHNSNLFNRLSTTVGIRSDYSSAQNSFHLSPRFSFQFRIAEKLSLNGGFGMIYQTIPINYLTYLPEAVEVKDMKASHYLLGLKYFSGKGTKISLEAFYKNYQHLPASYDLPYALVTDWVLISTYHKKDFEISDFMIPPNLSLEGTTGYSSGVELFLHQRLVNKFYCILSATYFRSRYKDLNGIMRDRIFDNRYNMNLMLGYKPNRSWEFSLRWTVVGGAPYTPIDEVQSELLNKWILDISRYNGARYPRYETLNARVDRRWYFGKSNLVVFIDIWNILNRKNVRCYFYDSANRIFDQDYQLGILPILGLEFEF
ncbi:MAG: TonB-dependent receptor [Candidatus Aminicenantes bacterium]|nr:TonB-dependent receptor [Candidatus Aminicenantes bacterium]